MSNDNLKKECVKYQLQVSEKQFSNVQTLANYLKSYVEPPVKIIET